MTSGWPSLQPGQLGTDDAHLCVVVLDEVSRLWPSLPSILSADERQRAARFLSDVDARRYMAGRAALRKLLGAYVGIEPARLPFAYSPFGKPRLTADASSASVEFSVSHSGELGLLGFTRGHRIGVDVECSRPDIEVEDLARRFFSQGEFERLRALPSDQQLDAFYRCWTRKEAYLKAHGEGVSFGLDKFEVSFEPDKPAAILNADDDPAVSKKWVFKHLAPAPGYLGAAAIESENITFRCFRWEPDPAR